MLSENGNKCVNNTEFIKIKYYSQDGKIFTIPETMSCKNYCYEHKNIILNALRKTYNIVYINDVEFFINNLFILINGEPIINYTDVEFYELITKKVTISIIATFLDNVELPDIINKIQWGNNKERWITTQDWVITKNMLIYKYDIEYISNVIRNNNMICESGIENLKPLGKGGYGVTQKSGDIVIKNMEIIHKNNYLIYNNIREIIFLNKFHHNNITYLKCIEHINVNDKLFKLHLKYDGLPMNKISLNEYKLPNKYLLNYDIPNKSNLTYIIYQLMKLFDDLNKFGIIHGDIKPQNILINDVYKVTVIDWGSVSLNVYGKSINNGTFHFTDPESYFPEKNERWIGTKNDIYSIGLTILFLYTKVYFDIHTYIEPLYMVGKDIDISRIDDEFIKNIVYDMTNLNYEDRSDTQDILQKYFYNLEDNKLFNYKFDIKFDYTINDNYNFLKVYDVNNNIFDFRNLRNLIIDYLLEKIKELNILNCFVLSIYIFDIYCYLLSFSLTNDTILNIQLYALSSLVLAYICIYNKFDAPNIENYILKFCIDENNCQLFSLGSLYNTILHILYKSQFNIYKYTFDVYLHYYTIESQDLYKIYDILKNICKNNILLFNDNEYYINIYNNSINAINLNKYKIM